MPTYTIQVHEITSPVPGSNPDAKGATSVIYEQTVPTLDLGKLVALVNAKPRAPRKPRQPKGGAS